MNDEQLKDFLGYLTDVLGIKEIFIENELSKKVDLSIFVENYSLLSAAESELLKKMIEALKLSKQSMQILDFNSDGFEKSEGDQFNSVFQIYLVNNPSAFQEKVSAHSVVTFSPTILQTKAQFKKEAWTELQKVMAYFKAN